ncbi:MAG: LysM peptidoglycan-binding domain-containing protein [Verrucomicrobiota bacterium]
MIEQCCKLLGLACAGLIYSYILPANAIAISASQLNSQLYAESALLVDQATGKILYEKRPKSKRYPASTVKLLTALLVWEKTKLEGMVTVHADDTKVEPSHIPLKVGEQVSVKDLVYSLLIGSDNDSGMALARHVAGSIPNFAKMMNARAKALGCTHSNFTNPHGLPDPKQVVCAKDMLKIFQAVIMIPELRQICTTKNFVLKTKARTQTVKNHNKLLGKYPGMGPAKTGWTHASQHTYAASVSRNGRELHLIILKSKNKWMDAPKLLDYGFANLPEIRNVAQLQMKTSSISSTPESKYEDERSMPLPVKRLPIAPTTATKSRPKIVTNAVPHPSPNYIRHVVKRGDTLYSISRRYGSKISELIAINNIKDPNLIRVGTSLNIPSSVMVPNDSS